MEVLVTGADGFIGSHVAEVLVRSGHEVRALAQYNFSGSAGWLDYVNQDVASSVEVRLGDIRDRSFVESLVKGSDAVMHLAALVGIPYSYHAPDSYVDTNVQGTMNLLNAARNADVQHFIHTSTSEVYGTAESVPMDEKHPLRAQSPYAASKIAADQMALSYFRSFGTPVTVIRPFNTFGPRQSLRAIIPTIMTQVAQGKPTVEVGSTTPTRDFTFVTDTARAFSMALLAKEETVGEVINLGTGHEVSVAELIELVAAVSGRDIEVVHQSDRTRPAGSEVERLVSDNRKAQELLGWLPERAGRAGLESGLLETFRWFSDPANLALYRASGYVV